MLAVFARLHVQAQPPGELLIYPVGSVRQRLVAELAAVRRRRPPIVASYVGNESTGASHPANRGVPERLPLRSVGPDFLRDYLVKAILADA